MKKRTEYTIVLLLAVNVLTATILGYVAWRSMFWKQEALLAADFAGKLLAASNYARGKHIKYRLVIREDFTDSPRQPTEFEGPYVVRHWDGYIDPLFKDVDSPSVLVARRFVEAHNHRLAKIMADRTRYDE